MRAVGGANEGSPLREGDLLPRAAGETSTALGRNGSGNGVVAARGSGSTGVCLCGRVRFSQGRGATCCGRGLSRSWVAHRLTVDLDHVPRPGSRFAWRGAGGRQWQRGPSREADPQQRRLGRDIPPGKPILARRGGDRYVGGSGGRVIFETVLLHRGDWRPGEGTATHRE